MAREIGLLASVAVVIYGATYAGYLIRLTNYHAKLKRSVEISSGNAWMGLLFETWNPVAPTWVEHSMIAHVMFIVFACVRYLV